MRPRSRYNEALSFIEGGLEDISISRKSITWGIPVPWDPEQVIYVWVDALINYVSALTYARPGEDLIGRYWPADVHLLAKDILKFHAVIWPALLWSAGYEAPRGEFIHGYLLMGGEKMSKTRGNVLDPFAVIEQCGIDALRFYLFREVTFGQDGVISLEGFEQRYNNELANELGNLVSRVVSMIGKYRDGHLSAAPRAGRRRGAWPRRARPWSPPSAGASSAVEITAGARDARGSSCAASTATSRKRRPGSSPRTRRRRTASTRCSTVSPPACASSPCRSTRSCPARPSRSCAVSASRTSPPTCCSSARAGTALAAADVVPAPSLFPRIEAEA